MSSKIKRLYYTLKPLKPIQFWGMFYYRIYRRVLPFKVPSTNIKTLEKRSISFPKYQETSWLGGMKFSFLNSTAVVDKETWIANEQSLLWHYNLHYFDDLNAVLSSNDSFKQAVLLTDWWNHHVEKLGVAWEPYPTSLRAVNLCKWSLEVDDLNSLIDSTTWIKILDRHYQEIKRKLEYHLQANHLFANLKALWFLQAALPEYRDKDGKWLSKLIARELSVQFDSKGGHFELSPMYHRIMLWDLFDMIIIGRQITDFKETVSKITAVAEKSITWAAALSHPDNDISFFNDGSMGIAPSLSCLESYAKQLNITPLPYINGEYSGYVVQTHENAKLICDVASVGPAFQPGHAHADTLSFELSIGKQRVVVNSGTSEYGVSSERLRQRSTPAHNTVALENKNSSDIWSGFRVGRQAKIVAKKIVLNQDNSIVEAAHDGYKPTTHHRKWIFTPNSLTIYDSFMQPKNKRSEVKHSYLHLHPDINVLQESDLQLLLTWPTGKARLLVDTSNATLEVKAGTWHPAFGKVVENKYLQLIWSGKHSEITLSWGEA